MTEVLRDDPTEWGLEPDWVQRAGDERRAASMARARKMIEAARRDALERARKAHDALSALERRKAKPIPLTSAIGKQLGIRKARRAGGSMPWISIQHQGDDHDGQ